MMGSSQRRLRRIVIAAVVVVAGTAVLSGCPTGLGRGDGNGTDPDTYTVSYHANGEDSGTAPADQTKAEGVDLTLASNSGSLARTGYTYVGWNTADDGSGSDYAEGATYATDADLTLFAKWAAKQYTVTLNRQSGSGGSGSVSATFDEPMPSATAPSRTGYDFGGYYTGTGGTGTQYYTASMTSARNWDEPSDTTLYAKWTGGDYTVSFDRQGGSGGSTSVIATFGSAMPSATAPSKPGVVFDGYYTGLDGTGTQYYTATMDSARDWDIPANTELIASWIYEVGETGPAGGIVFYDKGAYSDGWRYLEAWTADEAVTYQWKMSNTSTPGTSTDVGSGYANTYSEMTGSEHPAAEVARNATHGGHDDWFLPSKDELNQMYLQRGVIGGFESAFYWSSSEYDAKSAWDQLFSNGSQYDYDKDNASRVRAARAF